MTKGRAASLVRLCCIQANKSREAEGVCKKQMAKNIMKTYVANGTLLTKYIAEKSADMTRTAGRNARKKEPPNLASCVKRGMRPCRDRHSWLGLVSWQD